MKQKLTDGTALLRSLLAVDPSKRISSAEAASYSCCLLWVGFPFSPTCCPRTFALPLSFCPSLSFWPPSAFSVFPPLLLDLCIVLSIPFLALIDYKSYVHRPGQLAKRGPLALGEKLTESLRDNEDLGLGAPDFGRRCVIYFSLSLFLIFPLRGFAPLLDFPPTLVFFLRGLPAFYLF